MSKKNHSKKFFKVVRNAEDNFSWNGYDIIPLGGNRVRVKSGDYDLTPEIQTAFTDTRYQFFNIDKDDQNILSFEKMLETLINNDAKNSKSKRTKPIKKDLKKTRRQNFEYSFSNATIGK